jgi:hypothetical protein
MQCLLEPKTLMKWFKPPSQKSALARVRKPWGGEMVDVDLYLAQAWAELGERQNGLVRQLKLAKASWTLLPDAGLIEFVRRDGSVMRGPAQIVGAWNPRQGAFTWGWGAAEAPPRMLKAAERTRWFGDKHGLSELTGRTLPADEREAWRFAAVAMKVNAAAGVYRAPTANAVVFMTFDDLVVTSEGGEAYAAE